MLPADEYERIYRTQGKRAADDAFDESMEEDARKMRKTVAICLVLLALGLWWL